jgi:hypothetical protein
MTKLSDRKIALFALIVFAGWLFVGLPLLYLPSQDQVHGEILGVKYGEWLLFGATVGLWVATVGLWWATWRLVKSAEKTAERQLGAYIGIEWCKVISNDWGNTFEVEVQIKNAGQTPAFDVTHRIAVGLQILHGEPLDFSMPKRRPSKLPIAPGITFILRTPIAIGGASGSRTITSGERAVFAWGRIDYEDVFDIGRYVEFRFRSAEIIRSTDAGGAIHVTGWRMDPEGDGNTATQDARRAFCSLGHDFNLLHSQFRKVP